MPSDGAVWLTYWSLFSGLTPGNAVVSSDTCCDLLQDSITDLPGCCAALLSYKGLLNLQVSRAVDVGKAY